ncbi:hypothetical protein KC887_01610 [Candidatus Kaiserbacteria bacterium]|nr:hypothetical protein [Candidatus Kaiserbacteria bacterium]
MKESIVVPIVVSLLTLIVAGVALVTHAQEPVFGNGDIPATTSTTTLAATTKSASSTAADLITLGKAAVTSGIDTTKPEDLPEKTAILQLFEARPVTSPFSLSVMAYWVQKTVAGGIPANTIYLILLTPFLAWLVSFTRIVIGLPTLDMLVPIALAFAFVAVGISIGLLILCAILIASYISKRSLARVRIMFYPKRSFSMLFLALAVFGALTVGLALNFDRILSLSIFPILILMLLGDLIVSVQLHKSSYETLMFTSTTIMLGLLGFILASSETLQNTLILYPELVLLVIPLNLLIGRYFGLRLVERLRFNKIAIE